MTTDAEFIEAVKESCSTRDLMSRLGYSASGATSKMLQARMSKMGLRFGKRPSRVTTLIPLEEILVENSTYTSRTLKDRLLKAGLLENRCYASGCAITDSWNGKPIVLQLEHKNGIHSDNRIDNLELLCPNCHTQTETWGGKSRNAPVV